MPTLLLRETPRPDVDTPPERLLDELPAGERPILPEVLVERPADELPEVERLLDEDDTLPRLLDEPVEVRPVDVAEPLRDELAVP